MSDVTTDNTVKISPWIWLALLLTIAVTLWATMQDDAEDGMPASVDLFAKKRPVKAGAQAKKMQHAKATPSHNRVKSRGGLIDWEKLDRTLEGAQPKNLFEAHSWVVAPPPPPRRVAPPPPPPRAPDVPFEYMGRLDNGPQGDLIYLAAGEDSYSVMLGSKVDGFWRLDKEDEYALYFTYLPLDLPQILPKGEGLAPPRLSANSGTLALPVQAF